MTVTAYCGPAGTGKTYRLMEQVKDEVTDRPLESHERVLALTYMHGSRRRLDSRLRGIAELNRHYQAMTLDSLAWRLCRRWRALAARLNGQLPDEAEFEATCALAAELLGRPEVASWVRVSYPYVVVDEAQDLTNPRSEMVRHLAASCQVLLAFDEFQCLDSSMGPMPIVSWLSDYCEPTILEKCHRTDDAELLAAARAVRNGCAPVREGSQFKVVPTPSKPLSATYLANFIAWRGDGNVAVLTPSRKGSFVDDVVELVRTRKLGKRQNGKYPIEWEVRPQEEADRIWGLTDLPGQCSPAAAAELLEPHRQEQGVQPVMDWIRHRGALGIDNLSADQIRKRINRTVSESRQFGGRPTRRFSAMTIQQAKNREFDHVAVLWPYTVPKNDDRRRRLLYNAITRARRSCLVMVQGEKLLDEAPFCD